MVSLLWRIWGSNRGGRLKSEKHRFFCVFSLIRLLHCSSIRLGRRLEAQSCQDRWSKLQSQNYICLGGVNTCDLGPWPLRKGLGMTINPIWRGSCGAGLGVHSVACSSMFWGWAGKSTNSNQRIQKRNQRNDFQINGFKKLISGFKTLQNHRVFDMYKSADSSNVDF